MTHEPKPEPKSDPKPKIQPNFHDSPIEKEGKTHRPKQVAIGNKSPSPVKGILRKPDSTKASAAAKGGLAKSASFLEHVLNEYEQKWKSGYTSPTTAKSATAFKGKNSGGK